MELVTLGGSIFGGGALTMASNIVNSGLTVVENLSKAGSIGESERRAFAIETAKLQASNNKSAREVKASAGFHRTRQAIALIVIISYFVVMPLLPFMASLVGIDILLSIGFIDITQGWPWQAPVENVHWITIGSPEGTPLVITPVMNNAVLSIIGMFFGNQMVKR